MELFQKIIREVGQQQYNKNKLISSITPGSNFKNSGIIGKIIQGNALN